MSEKTPARVRRSNGLIIPDKNHVIDGADPLEGDADGAGPPEGVCS